MNIFLTGATSGIGRVLAAGLAERGCTMHLHGRDKQRLADVAKLAVARGARVECYLADLASPAEIASMCETAAQKTDRLDILINNAFGRLEKPLGETEPDEIGPFFQVSVVAAAQVMRGLLELLKHGSNPKIVNIVADWGFPMHNIMTGPSIYIAAKYAMHGLGVALQREIAPLGIRTTNIFPGIVAADVPFEMSDAEFLQARGVSAIHPRTLVEAIRFVANAQHAHVRSIVLSPANPEYNGV